MSEEERYGAIQSALSYWLPVSWPEGGHRYTLTDTTMTGDADDGGVELEVSLDGTATATITFTNEECYGETPITPATARQRVHDGSYA